MSRAGRAQDALTLLRRAEHVLFAALLAIGAGEAWADGGHRAAVLPATLAVAAWYAVGMALSRRAAGVRMALLWLIVLTAGWIGAARAVAVLRLARLRAVPALPATAAPARRPARHGRADRDRRRRGGRAPRRAGLRHRARPGLRRRRRDRDHGRLPAAAPGERGPRRAGPRADRRRRNGWPRPSAARASSPNANASPGRSTTPSRRTCPASSCCCARPATPPTPARSWRSPNTRRGARWRTPGGWYAHWPRPS